MKYRKPHSPQWAHQIETLLAEWTVPLALAISSLLVITIIIPTSIDIYQSWGNIQAQERAKTGIELIQLVATVVGGIAIFWNIIIARRQLVATQEQNITDRFSKAVEQLGHDRASVRIGGVYALARIAQDSPRDYWSIMEVIATFVRDCRKLPPEGGLAQSPIQFDRDAQAGIVVIGRRNTKQDPDGKGLYLNHVDFRRMAFFSGDYSNVHFHRSDLREATFHQANLTHARFWQASLVRANLVEANLTDADLEEADLRETYLKNCILQGANLRKTNLQGAHDLTAEQVKSAKNWQEAVYSDEFLILLGSVDGETTT